MDKLVVIQWYDRIKMQAVLPFCPDTIHSFIMSLEANRMIIQWNIKDGLDLPFYKSLLWKKLIESENDWKY